MGYYILDGKTPVPVADILEWAKWMESDKRNRHVKDTKLPNGVRISTVFLGYTTSFGDEPDNFFETMVFYPPDWSHEKDDYETRYETWDEAEKHHNILVLLFSQYL